MTRTILLTILALPSITLAQLPSTATKPQIAILLSNGEVGGVLAAQSVERLTYMTREWSAAPPYQKVAFAEALLKTISSKADCPMPDWRPRGPHDLNLSGGRAMWALQELIGVQMPPTNAESLRNPAFLVEQAARAVAAYRAGVIEASRGQTSLKSLAELRKAYQGKIVLRDTKRAHGAANAMFALLLEWPPLGTRFSDFAEIVGSQGVVDGNIHEYTFDHGFGGPIFRFTVRDGLIHNVYIGALEQLVGFAPGKPIAGRPGWYAKCERCGFCRRGAARWDVRRRVGGNTARPARWPVLEGSSTTAQGLEVPGRSFTALRSVQDDCRT